MAVTAIKTYQHEDWTQIRGQVAGGAWENWYVGVNIGDPDIPPEDWYNIAYVENAAGKTTEVIRPAPRSASQQDYADRLSGG